MQQKTEIAISLADAAKFTDQTTEPRRSKAMFATNAIVMGDKTSHSETGNIISLSLVISVAQINVSIRSKIARSIRHVGIVFGHKLKKAGTSSLRVIMLTTPASKLAAPI